MTKNEGYNPDASIPGESQAKESGNHIGKESKTANIPDIFNGPIISTTIRLALPLMISNILFMVYMVVDTIFISMIDRNSTALISGTGLIFPLYFIFYAIGVGLLFGISSLVARGIGAKNQEVIDGTADSGLFLCAVLCIVFFISGLLFGRNMIHLFAGNQLTAETLEYATDYFYFFLPGLVLLLSLYMIAGILQGEGLTKSIATAGIISTVINIILDPILIFSFRMGVKGAALASSIAIGAAFLFCVTVFLRKKTIVPIHWNIFKANKRLIKEILRIGAPVSLMLLSANIAIIILNNLVGSISQMAMNSWVLVGRTDQLLLIPATAISGVTIAMLGQNYGRGNLQRVEKIFNIHIAMSVTACALFVIPYVIFSSAIFQLFSSLPEVVAGSVRQVHFVAFTYLGISSNFVVQSSFRATGVALPGLFIVVIRFLIIAIPLCLLLVHVFSMGMTGVYLGLITGNILSFIIALFWGRSNIKGLRLKKKRVLI